MKRTLIITLLAVVVAGAALATDVPNSAAMFPRVFNDCPFSILTQTNNYPTYVAFEDVKSNCGTVGFANRHAWRFSQDGANAQLFANHNGFRFGADVTLSGTGEGEFGIGISPWWSQLVDGVFNLRSTDGEVACFGGRLPFYSFTANQGVTYVKGTTVHLEIVYQPNGLTELDPATIEYIYGGFTSGPLPFDMGNPEEPYGIWGILDEATAGGNVQLFLQQGADDAYLLAEWENITFVDLGDVIAVESATWSGVKGLFR
ncbi:MAG TPA: hypothetical protein PLL30_02180 [Candidatus Krumholzibacteria bacterium]|nr:hypothetical protein [Candidatus Krumholzibacteria bacterium]HPD70575.1 hypothetical protein [Candidatus Krumholzibacteria bacterium]HRY39725.1 hypothetical protein [Candidatus Krumholzibacteria bacterium]